MKPSGQAGAGDCLVSPWGEVLEVVSVVNANDVIEAEVERSIAMRAPNFTRHSTTATCALFGDTTGRERRDHQRWKKRINGTGAPHV